jgi:hypothetical protein
VGVKGLLDALKGDCRWQAARPEPGAEEAPNRESEAVKKPRPKWLDLFGVNRSVISRMIAKERGERYS